MQGVFVHTEFRRFSVRSVRAFLPGRTCDVGYRNKVLPIFALVTPLYVGLGSLNLYVFGVCAVSAVFAVDTVSAVLAVDAVFSVNSVCAVFSVSTVNTVFTVDTVFAVDSVSAINTVFTVGTVFTVDSVSTVLAVCSGSTSQLGQSHKVAPIGFVTVFPLDSSAVVPNLRQGGVGFCRVTPCGKHDVKHQKSACE